MLVCAPIMATDWVVTKLVSEQVGPIGSVVMSPCVLVCLGDPCELCELFDLCEMADICFV